MFHLLRNFGSSLFISIAVAEIVRTSAANYARMVEHVSPYNRVLEMPWAMGSWAVDPHPRSPSCPARSRASRADRLYERVAALHDRGPGFAAPMPARAATEGRTGWPNSSPRKRLAG